MPGGRGQGGFLKGVLEREGTVRKRENSLFAVKVRLNYLLTESLLLVNLFNVASFREYSHL